MYIEELTDKSRELFDLKEYIDELKNIISTLEEKDNWR
jgi:hypothetical protein